jgi:D-threo-aldose 1-dehydrogenase
VNPFSTAEIGDTDVHVTRLGFGSAPLGGLFTGVEETTAADTVLAAYDSGIRYYDTAPFYGHGKSEVRLGNILAQYPRDNFVLSTKVGRVLVPAEGGAIEDHAYRDTLEYNPVFDLSADGIRRSFESSLERLGLDRIDIALLHDPDDHFDEAVEQAFPTLIHMREEGLVTAVGAGMNQSEMLYEFARRIDVDCFLLAGRYTLLDQSASKRLLPECENRGISIILGGPYNSGILAGGEHYNYEAAPIEMVEKKQRLDQLCREHDVPLMAAALQFPARHETVACVLAGARTAAEVRENVAMMNTDIPGSFWDALTEELDA